MNVVSYLTLALTLHYKSEAWAATHPHPLWYFWNVPLALPTMTRKNWTGELFNGGTLSALF